jgi:2-oxoglutarate ferredoxin oxidoreductase subunit alpha
MLDDAEVVVAAYGSTARVCRKAVDLARKKGIPAGLLRPISLWPFPERAFKAVVAQARCFLVVEMSLGQMIEDVRLATECRRQVFFYGRTGGVVPTPAEVLEAIEKAHLATAEGGAPATSGGGDDELRAERGCPR